MPKLSCTFSLSTRVYEILKASAEVDNNSMSGYLEKLISGDSKPVKTDTPKHTEKREKGPEVAENGVKKKSLKDIMNQMHSENH